MNLLERYHAVTDVLDNIDFDRLFPGFHRFRWALYNSDTICLDGDLLPYDERFRGNTSILYDGEYIAIWNMDADPIEDTELLASSLVHEMFHCYQNTLGEKRFPSDLTLLNYPEDIENYTRKYNENCLLADAYEHSDANALSMFAAIRNQRFSQYPAMVQEEWKAETVEGMAEYIGLKALACVNREKFRDRLDGYLRLLRSESKLQFDIRRISYYTGTVFLLCLERLGNTVRNDIGSALTVYEQNPVTPADSVVIHPCKSMTAMHRELVNEKKQAIEEHIFAAAYTECEGEICGYDPMNMFRWGNMICCKHFVMLKIGTEMQTFPRKIVLILKDDSDRRVKGYY